MSTPGMDRSNLRTPLKDVRGLGSAKSGTHHFIVQRVTGVALVLLTVWIVGFVLALVHAGDYAHAREMLRHPFAAAWMIAFVVVALWHAQLGLQVVIEDYIHDRAMHLALRILLILGSLVGVLSAIYAIARIAMTA